MSSSEKPFSPISSLKCHTVILAKTKTSSPKNKSEFLPYIVNTDRFIGKALKHKINLRIRMLQESAIHSLENQISYYHQSTQLNI